MKQYQHSIVQKNWERGNSVIKLPSLDPHFRDQRQKEAKKQGSNLDTQKLQHLLYSQKKSTNLYGPVSHKPHQKQS